MPHSHIGRLPSKNPRHQQPPQDVQGETTLSSLGSDEAQGQLVRAGGGPTEQLPIEQPQPWSHWIPGDDGRWFYQGRRKADGSGWEYQFTDGYPSTSGRLLANNPYYPAVLDRNVSIPLNIIPQVVVEEQNQGPNGSWKYTAPTVVEGQEATPYGNIKTSFPQTEDAAAYGQMQLIVSTTPAQSPARERSQARSRISDNGHGNPVRGRKKKLGAIVKAEKELRFNPKKSVKKWLSNVDP